MLVTDLEAEARAAGMLGDRQRIGQCKPFRSARDELEIATDREGFGPGSKCYWSLLTAPYVPSDPIGALPQERAPMDEQGTYGDPEPGGPMPDAVEEADLPPGAEVKI
jgi:hypothetical protein